MEQGDDLSMVDFRCAGYHNGKVIADAETIRRIKEFGIRKLQRLANISRETIIPVTKKKPVKPSTLRALIVSMDEYEKRTIVLRYSGKVCVTTP